MKIDFNSLVTRLLILIIVPWIILAIVFGAYDLEISILAVQDFNQGWGNFGADFGEAPGYALIGISIAIAAGSLYGNIKKQKIPALIVIFVGFMIFLIGIVGDDMDWIILGPSIFGSMTCFLIVTFNKDYKKCQTIALVIVILALINPLLFVQIVKLIWGRIRFRDLALNYSNYTPWYVINGYNGNQSFPSGHTAMGWMFLPLLILVKDRNWKDPIKMITWILVIGWGLFVGLSRVVVGAHYASDVLFSSGMASIITILLYKKFYMNKKPNKAA